MKVARQLLPGLRVRNAPVPAGRYDWVLNGVLGSESGGQPGMTITPSLRDGSPFGQVPGISCLATFIQSLRDKNHSDPVYKIDARSPWFALFEDEDDDEDEYD